MGVYTIGNMRRCIRYNSTDDLPLFSLGLSVWLNPPPRSRQVTLTCRPNCQRSAIIISVEEYNVQKCTERWLINNSLVVNCTNISPSSWRLFIAMPAPLKLRPYSAIQKCLLLILLINAKPLLVPTETTVLTLVTSLCRWLSLHRETDDRIGRGISSARHKTPHWTLRRFCLSEFRADDDVRRLLWRTDGRTDGRRGAYIPRECACQSVGSRHSAAVHERGKW